MLPANTVLQNRYRIVRQLGRGGMGAVYEAVDQRLSSIVAIKEMLLATDDARRAFEREASLLANLRHRSLPSVTDHFAEGEGQFLVMQFIPGEDLAQLLELRKRAFPPAQVAKWAEDILAALEYLHSHNPPILHRDIKPANLKLTREGELFLIDFGLSKGAAGQMPTLLTSRSVKGYTPAYAPLEQIHGGGTHPGSDLYSVGATLYHLLTYVAPADAPTRFNALDDLQPDPMPAADQVNPQVPHALAQALSQAMAMNRRNRPASAMAMRRMIREALPLAGEEAVTVQMKFEEAEPAAPPASPREEAVTMRKEAASVRTPDVISSPVAVPPTQPAAVTHPLSPTRSTDSLDLEMAPKVANAGIPTIEETPTLIDRIAPVPAAAGFPVTPEPAGPAPQPAVASEHRRMSRPLMAALVAVPVLLVLVTGALLGARWMANRKTVQNQTIQTASSAGDHPTSTDKPAEMPTKKFFTGEFNVGKALELLYGSYDYQKKYVKWKLTAEDIKKSPIGEQGSGLVGTVYTAPNFFQSFTQAGAQRYLLITETVPARYDCHACAPAIGGAVFSQVGNNWQLEAENKLITTMGSFGGAPKGKLIKIGQDRHGAMFNAGGMGQGISEEVAVVIADVGETLKEILTIDEFGGDNGGACGEGMAPCYSFTSKLEFVPGANAEFYDAKVTTTGTKEDDQGKVRRANAVKKYLYADGKYILGK
ncbi:MAG: protein kinase [Acidobacteriota bacterium]